MEEEVEGLADGLAQFDGGLPVEQAPGVVDARLAVGHVLVAVAVEAAALHLAEAGEGRELRAQRVGLELAQQFLAELADARLVVRVADVDDLPVAAAVAVVDDPREGLDAVVDVGEAALLRAAVDQADRRAFDQVQDEAG